jgi:hypothetical protein
MVGMSRPRVPEEEIVPLGEEIYERDVRPKLGPGDEGKFEVLDLSEALSSRAGRSAERDTRAALLKYAGTISREDLDIISETIEEGCERVDEEGW